MLGYVEQDARTRSWRAFRATGLPLEHTSRADATGGYGTRELALADVATDDEARLRARAAAARDRSRP
ncbi:hypothetical protein EBO15_24675 [Actinomadura harenae]|uniref:Uncharacterized protein n=1 Tax=Actinomadura harenae TaxID=2483351 RepID=A0A3M2LWR7_9ACTN|nr:hypothetical protein EBO15_24675 [Actinomadura harenae]